MSPPDLSPWYKIPQMLPLRGCLFAVAATACLAALTPVSATPVTYVFDPSAALVSPDFVPNPTPVTGAFTVDLAANTESNVTISFTSSAVTSIFLAANDTLTDNFFGGNAIHACEGSANVALCSGFILHLHFAVPLDGAGPAPLDRFGIDVADMVVVSGSASGTASPVTTPEPTSLALMAAALGLFLLGRRAKSYGPQARLQHRPRTKA